MQSRNNHKAYVRKPIDIKLTNSVALTESLLTAGSGEGYGRAGKRRSSRVNTGNVLPLSRSVSDALLEHVSGMSVVV